jgi:hypothetical protein
LGRKRGQFVDENECFLQGSIIKLILFATLTLGFCPRLKHNREASWESILELKHTCTSVKENAKM